MPPEKTVSAPKRGMVVAASGQARIAKPEPRKDYLIFVQFDKKRCWLSVSRIDDKGADESVPLEHAPKCLPS